MIDFLRMNRFQIIAVSAAVICVVLLVVLLFVPPDARDTSREEITIAPGQGLSSIAAMLSDAGLIRNRFLFMAYARAAGVESRLQAGTYRLSRSFSIPRVTMMLARGLAELSDVEVVIPEGSNLWEVDKRLTDAGLISEGEFAGAYLHKEGYLFPDTYRFAQEAKLEDILSKIEDTYARKVAIRSDIGSGIDVIIASMLEKEAKRSEDMAIISGIIRERLRRAMLLQIDATVAYGWCLKEFEFRPSRDCDVTRAPIAAEIAIDGPYNTYRRAGLPEGAISNPGITALRAAANPRKTDYLYYLSTRDGSEIIYAKTLAEHQRNRARYLGL